MKNRVLVMAGLLSALIMTSCSNGGTTKQQSGKDTVSTIQKVDTLEMSQDTIDARIMKDVMAEIAKRRLELTKEAISSVSETENLIRLIESDKAEEAKKKGQELIGKLELLLAKDSTLNLIPVDVTYQRKELVSDMETVNSLVDDAEKAFDEGYYQAAADILEKLKSEIVIRTTYIPLATYPDGIKTSLLLLDNGDTAGSLAVLQQVLSSVVVGETVLPLPVLNAEQMVIEASAVYDKDKNNTEKILNLLDNADYQLKLAEAMGYGKKDKDYQYLADSIRELKKSVSEKKDSKSLFNNLKQKIHEFKDRLFPINRK